jgi:anti-sigma regulatory factor (Ser/Thr protein kinase)
MGRRPSYVFAVVDLLQDRLMNRSDRLLAMRFRSNPELLCIVRAALGQMTETLGFSSEAGRAVVLAVDEALANVIRHAYEGRADGPIAISFRRGETCREGRWNDALEIEIEDRGVPIKLEELRGRRLDEIRPGGLGLHFIRENMDSVEFLRENGKNRLRLMKILGVTEPRKEC